jgi:hypothetical protein
VSDIVIKLRKFAEIQPPGNGPSNLAIEAADEIERLRTEVKRLQNFAKVDAAEIELLGKKVDALQRRCAYLVRDTPYWQVYR